METTDLNGSLLQPSSGVYNVDVNFQTGTSDRINATGNANLNGTVAVTIDNVANLRPGANNFTILSAAGGVTNAGITVNSANSVVAQYGLSYPNPTDAVLTVNVNFAPAASAVLNTNDTAIGNYFNAIQSAGSSTALAPVVQKLFTLPDAQSLHDFYQTISPAPFLATEFAVAQTGTQLTDSMLSCHPETGDGFRFSQESECSWLRVTPRTLTLAHTAASMGSSSRATDITAGHQFVLDDNFRLGLAASFTNDASQVENYSSANGQGFAGGAVVKALFDPLVVALAVTGGENTSHTSRNVAGSAVAKSRQYDAFLNERARVSLQAWGEDNFYLRPLAELNATQMRNGAFQESGAGALDLLVPTSHYQFGTAGVGVEAGGEVDFGPAAVLRPFVGYEFKQNVWGNTQSIAASFEGAPAGVAPLLVTNTPDRNLHQVTAGLDLITSDNVDIRFQYTGSFGEKTRQDTFGFKLALPF